MNSKGKLGILASATALVGALSGLGSQAKAAGTVPITFTAVSGGTNRTLNLFNTDGSKPAAVNLSSGAGGFLAQVADSGIDPAVLGKFDVEATMSNLYLSTAPSTFDCTAPAIPAADVQLASLPNLLDANGLNAVLQPILTLTGNLSVLNTSTLSVVGISFPNTTTTITGVNSQLTSTVSQALMAGSSLSDLTGAVLSNGALPFDLSSTSATPSAFTNEDPTNSPCPDSSANTPTQRQVLHGALNTLPGPLQGEVQTVLNKLSNPSAPSNPTLSWLVSQGYVSATTAESLIETATGLTATQLNGTTGLLSSIESTLTATVTGVVSAATQLTGTYGANPSLNINAPGAAPGSYQGVLTVTMTSN